MPIVFALWLSLQAAPDAGPRQVVFGKDRPVTLLVPRSYAGKPTPLLLVLHGYGSSGPHHQEYLGLAKLVEAHGVLLASPDGTLDTAGDRFWNTGSAACCNFHGSAVDDLKYLRELLAEIRRVYDVDPKRVYVVGHSNGGVMAHRLGCELAGQVSAIVSLAGSMPVEECHPAKVVRVSESQDRAPPTPNPTRATVRRSPKLPLCCASSPKSRSKSGMVLRLTIPPAAFPHAALPFERSTSTRSTVARSTWSNAVRPSGSVSGIPSSRMRTPREVPALERSPAPRAPYPRMVSRMSCEPWRLWANTPGTWFRA